jgi:hypothetical protein
VTFYFKNMSPQVRQRISTEISAAEQSSNFYMSTRFNQNGTNGAVSLLIQAAEGHDEHWLAYQIEAQVLMKEYEVRSLPLGGYTTAHVPSTAAETYAEGQFNRFYMIGVCLEAISQGKQVKVYRAKQVANSRGSSNNLIGSLIDPSALITELRLMKSSLGHFLLMPNSGLSIEID